MTGRPPPLNRALADRAIALGIRRAARHRHLLDLARQHHVELPALRVDDERAIDAAVALLEHAGADIDWDLVEIPTHLETTP